MLVLDECNVIIGRNTPLERKLFSNMNLHVKEGEFVVIVGGNGAGKSTFFQVLSGMMAIDSGTLTIDGQNMSRFSAEKRARYIAKVNQDPRIGTMENMTILENMAFAFKRGQKRGLSFFHTAQRREFFKEKLSLLKMGLENRLDDLVLHLSGGQRQALSFIMAIVQRSPLLLLDEITAALDPKTSESMMDLIDTIVKQEHLTCLMITHHMAHAITYGNRLLFLKDGHFVRDYGKEEKAKLCPIKILEEFGEI